MVRYRALGIGLACLLCLQAAGVLCAQENLSPVGPSPQANRLTGEGLQKIQDGNWDEGLALIKKASEINPQDSLTRMNYGGTLFTRGRQLWEEGDRVRAKDLFAQAETELLAALQSPSPGELVSGQSAFLLGDIYFYAYQNKDKAREFYATAAKHGHPSAEAALKTLGEGGAGAPPEKQSEGQEVPVIQLPPPAFDTRSWKVGNQASDSLVTLVEYVLEGETVENWSEMVRVQFFKGLQQKTSASEFMEGTKKKLQEACSAITWNVLSQSPGDVMYEWKIISCGTEEKQHELARIIATPTGIYNIAYVTKKLPLADDVRAGWLNRLKSYTAP